MPRNIKAHRLAKVDFKGEKCSNATHAPTTAPNAWLYKKSGGTGAILYVLRHSLTENCNGLIVQADQIEARPTPRVAQKLRYSAIDGRNTSLEVYDLSQKHRKKIEEAFGWTKTVGCMAQTMYHGDERVRSRFILTMAANNPAKFSRLLTA